MKPLKRLLILLLLVCASALGFAPSALAFCGFYVAKADSKLYNQASQVAIAHRGNHTVLTMANDYQGPITGARSDTGDSAHGPGAAGHL
jgi:hypothetical protein